MPAKYYIILTYLAIISVVIIAGLYFVLMPKNKNINAAQAPLPGKIIATDTPAVASGAEKNILATVNRKKLIAEPIADALARITKKPFGIYVSPGHSPVNPERFTGYHTGVDFEAFASEASSAVPVYAICAGTLAIKETARGYGGMAVERCRIGGQNVTVVYGHLKLTSITAKVGEKLSAGEELAILGKGYSAETDGERKHLHLGIHKGTTINTSGYVSAAAQLSGWIDVVQYLK
ncbi:MAG TPA: M23 family metallopeptidase [Candidatus Nanoarchaeia archaeon]|nr:M23 family metallopeptidase [Candidatus Nanoarchaeia archaeon]